MSALGNEYDDEYAVCVRTYATLRIYTGDLAPEPISEILACQPTRIWHQKACSEHPAKPFNAWFLSTRELLQSRESRRHFDHLLALLDGKQALLDDYLQGQGYRDMVCFWQSNGDQGGPKLDAKHAQVLAAAGIEVSWNIYFDANARKA